MISPLFRMEGDEARGLLFGLVESNKIQLRKDPSMPSVRQLISEGKVRYDSYDPKEHWKTYREIVDEAGRDGVAYGDCEDLAAAVAAEDQVRYGVGSLPYAYSPRPGLFHVVTAVPSSGVGRSSMGGTNPSLPAAYGGWPTADGAHRIDGYVLQDPSRAAGMGSFGYAPEQEANVTQYGRDGRGLGGLVGSFREGLLGGSSSRQAASDLGAGVRKGSGIEQGWAGQLGEQIPGLLGVHRASAPEGDSSRKAAVSALRKGMDQQGEEAPSADLDEEEDDFDEEFGSIGDAVAADMFGEDDDEEDGGFQLGHLPSWLLPAAAGVAVGAAGVGAAVALSRSHKKKKASRDSFGGIGDVVASEMFGCSSSDSFAGMGDLKRADLFGSLRREDLFGADDEDFSLSEDFGDDDDFED